VGFCWDYSILVGLVNRLPAIPAFLPPPMTQPIHVNGLAEGLFRIVHRSDLQSGIFSLAEPEPVSFSTFRRAIARSQLYGLRIRVPVPVVAIKLLAFAIGSSLRERSGLDCRNSLFDLPLLITSPDLQRLGLSLRPLQSGIHRLGRNRRRLLLPEGLAPLAYVLKEQPRHVRLRRYMCAIEKLPLGDLLGLPTGFLRCPALLSLAEESSWVDKAAAKEFSWPLDATTLLAAADPLGATRFLGLGRPAGFPVSPAAGQAATPFKQQHTSGSFPGRFVLQATPARQDVLSSIQGHADMLDIFRIARKVHLRIVAIPMAALEREWWLTWQQAW
jgi:hypothetical protein